MMSKRSMDYLFNHILDGFRSSHEGIINLQQKKIVSDDEINELVKKNSERLIDRIKEFKVLEKVAGEEVKSFERYSRYKKHNQLFNL